MASLNKCMFIGNVGKVESSTMKNGEIVSNFSIACNEAWKSNSLPAKEHVEWIRCTAYGKLANVVKKYIKVGQQVYVEGRMHTYKWQTKEGQTRYTTEIVVKEITMLGKKVSDDALEDMFNKENEKEKAALFKAKQTDVFEDDIS